MSTSLTFGQVQNSLESLTQIKDSIANQLPSYTSTTVFGVGLDEINNRVVVDSSSPNAGPTPDGVGSPVPANPTESDLLSKYGSSILEFQSEAAPTTTSYGQGDSPPWKGGDFLQMPTLVGTYDCTAGPGVQDSGYYFILTAGHCAYDDGTNFAGNLTAYNDANNTNPVGEFQAAVIGGQTPSSYGMDSGLVSAASGDQFWRWNTSTLDTFYGSANPTSGLEVYSEGISGGETAGTLIQDDVDFVAHGPEFPGGVEYVSDTDEFRGIIASGDSGGPDWFNNLYGYPIVGGTNVGFGTGSSSGYSFFQDITVPLYLWSVYYGGSFTVNTP